MTICLVMIVRNEEAVLPRCLLHVRDLIDRYCIVDTGSTDDTRGVIERVLSDVPGEVYERPWRSFGDNLTELLELAPDEGWLLAHLHADMVVEFHADLREWLATDPDPTVDAWQVPITQGRWTYSLPMLLRASLPWRYVGPTHEYLDGTGRRQRPLLGLSVRHEADGRNREGKFTRDIELLAPGVAEGDPRAVFYTAESLRNLGMGEEAAAMYDRRAAMNGWEEERWYAAYQAAALREDVAALIDCWRDRPHRHEPLQVAARIVRSRGTADILFVDTGGEA